MKALLSFAAAAVLISAASVSSANPTPRDHDCCKAEAQIVLSLDVPCVCEINLDVTEYDLKNVTYRQAVSGIDASCNGPGGLFIRARSENGGQLELPDGTDPVVYHVNISNTGLTTQQLTTNFQSFSYDSMAVDHNVVLLFQNAPAVFGVHSDTIYLEISPFM